MSTYMARQHWHPIWDRIKATGQKLISSERKVQVLKSDKHKEQSFVKTANSLTGAEMHSGAHSTSALSQDGGCCLKTPQLW